MRTIHSVLGMIGVIGKGNTISAHAEKQPSIKCNVTILTYCTGATISQITGAIYSMQKSSSKMHTSTEQVNFQTINYHSSKTT